MATSSPPPGTSGSSTGAADSDEGMPDTTEDGADDGSGTTGETGADGTTTGAAWQHDVHTVLTDAGRLAFESNLPRDVAECPAGAPCDDVDEDGLNDAWEDAALDRLRPLRRFDEAEAAVTDPTAGLADIGRVFPVRDAVHLYVMLGYARDYGSCGGFTSHNGDSERVAIGVVDHREGGPGGVVVNAVYTAAHEGTINDHGQVLVGDALDPLVFTPDPETEEPRWVVFPSAGKHATYPTIEICEGVSPLPCLDEDCAPDGVDDPDEYDVLPPTFNAGEPDAPRLTDLTPAGYPGDDAWADQQFCGGLGGGMCSSSVLEKLTVDPFD